MGSEMTTSSIPFKDQNVSLNSTKAYVSFVETTTVVLPDDIRDLLPLGGKSKCEKIYVKYYQVNLFADFQKNQTILSQ